MFLSKLFRKENKPEPTEATGIEHLAPSAYFTPARMEDLRATFERLGIRVTSVAPIDS